MTEKQKEQRLEAIERKGVICPVCHKPFINGQYAHRIANKEMWRNKYGSFIIDNTLNGEYVCSLGCNHSIDVGSSYGNHLEVIIKIVIAEAFKMWGKNGLDKITDELLSEYRKKSYVLTNN